MGCLRLCGVRTAGEATRQAELSPFSIAPCGRRLQHRIVFNMPSSSIPPDGMISIIKVLASRGRPRCPTSGVTATKPHPLVGSSRPRDVQADACTHVRVEISRLAPQEVYEH